MFHENKTKHVKATQQGINVLHKIRHCCQLRDLHHTTKTVEDHIKGPSSLH